MLLARTPLSRKVALRPAPGADEQEAREREIGVALQRGEGHAAAALWDHFAPLVRGLLARALGPDEEVEDAMQEVFLRVFHRGRRLRDPALLRSYVVAITVHLIRSQFRRRRVRRAFAQLMRSGHAPAVVATVDPAPGLALRALYRALEQLPSSERLAFSLRFFEGAEINEAAALLSTSPATFKRRLAAAKQRLWQLTGQDAVLAPYLADRRQGGGEGNS
jgi:RNA polymerase sigma-70 factor (ECF subfamily)